jgi:hypothetical protein
MEDLERFYGPLPVSRLGEGSLGLAAGCPADEARASGQ